MLSPFRAAITWTSHLTTFDALAQPAYRRLWSGAWLWYTCRWMEMVVLSWLVLQLTNSPFMVSMVGVSRMLPMLLLGLVAGSLADRFPRTRVMLAAQAINLVSTTAMMTLIVTGRIEAWHTFVAIFITGTGFTLDFSARRSFYAEIFPVSGLSNAISLDTVAMMGSSLIGPLVGGALISFAGYKGTYAILVIMFLTAILLLFTVQRPGPQRPKRTAGGVATQVLEAVRAIRGNRGLKATLLVTICFNFFGSPYFQMVPVIARDVLGVGSVRYGLLGAATGLGALAGALLIASWRVRRQGMVYTLGAALMLGAVVLFAVSPTYLVSLGLLLAVGMGLSGFATMQSALAMQAVAPELRGRALGAISLGIGAGPLGMLLLGNLAEVVGAPIALAAFAGIGCLLVLVLYWRLPELRARRE